MQYRTQIYLTEEEEQSFYKLLDDFLAKYPEKKCHEMIHKIRGWDKPTCCSYCHQISLWRLVEKEREEAPRYYCTKCWTKSSLKLDTLLHKSVTPLKIWVLFINLLIYYKNPSVISKKLIEKHIKVYLNTSKKIISTLVEADILKYDDLNTFLKHFLSIPIKRGVNSSNIQDCKNHNSHGLLTSSRQNMVYQYRKDPHYDLKLKIWGWLTLKPVVIISVDGLSREIGIGHTTIRHVIKEMEREKVLYKSFVTIKTLPSDIPNYHNLYQDLKDIKGKGTMLIRVAQVYEPSCYKNNT